MAKTIYTNKDSISGKVKKLYTNVDGKSRKVKKVYANVDGKARLCYNAVQIIGAVPSQSRSLIYNGSSLSPNWIGYDTDKMVIGGTTTAINAGTYTATFTAKEGWQRADGSTIKNVSWSINKASGNVSLSTSSVSITSSGGSKQVTVTRSGNGTITASSSNTSVATVSVNGNVVTISDGGSDGSCTVTINVGTGTNHHSTSAVVSVSRNVYVCPVPATLGATCSWAGYSWIVVHIESDRIYAARTEIYEKCEFNSNSSNAYAGSNLAARALAFQNSLPADALANAVDTTVNGVTAKIFAASFEQMSSGFSYFKYNGYRTCKYNGTADWYWTSSPNGSNVYCVISDGSIYDSYPTATHGFRPFVALKR